MNFLSALYTELIYRPLLNGLVLIYAILPGQDLGVAIVVLCGLIRLILHPTAVQTIRTQYVMPRLEARRRELQQKFKNDKEEQARHILALYREYGIHPLASILPLLIQIPVLFGLYRVFQQGILLDRPDLLYTFLPSVTVLDPLAFGLFDLRERSMMLALAAGASQFLQSWFMPRPAHLPETKQDDFARAWQWQSTYLLPVIFAAISWSFPAAIAFSWTILNLFAIVQQLWIQRRLGHEHDSRTPHSNTHQNGHPR